MKAFHISDLLSVTTKRLVSSRYMEGFCDILSYLTDDDLFTHQLPRAMKECEPCLREQFPQLFPDNPDMIKWLERLDTAINGITDKDLIEAVVAQWVESVRGDLNLPEQIMIMSAVAKADHVRRDPIQELEETVGKDRVIPITID